MKQLVGDVFIVSGKDLTHPWDASAYLIPGHEPTLIDCGGLHGYDALKQALAGFGYQPGNIVRVIGTHGHWDHLSGLARLRAESDAELWLHDADREQVETGDSLRTAAFLYNRPFPPIRVDRLLRDGETISVNGLSLQVHHTPGHSPGSVSFLTETGGQRLLISGDTVWGGYQPLVGSDLEAWRLSLDRLLSLEFDVMTIGHWGGLIKNAHDKVEKARKTFGAYFDPWFSLEGFDQAESTAS